MKITDFVGYGDRLWQLMRSVQAGRIVHALLFTGPHGSGKRTMACLFAQALLCRGESPRPCGTCPACKRFIAGLHPDVRTVKPAKDKKVIPIDDIRDLIDYMSMRPYEGGVHIAIIEQAEKMNAPAQNALLKTLETPPGDGLFFLISENPGALLSTIRSRCQAVRFHDLSIEDCAAVLTARGIPSDRARLLSGLSQGSVGRALELDADGDFTALREKTLQSLEALSTPASVARAAAMLEEDKGGEAAMMDIMELWARDLMAISVGATPYQLSDIERLKRCRVDGQRLLMGVMRMRSEYMSNVTWPNALETMYFELADNMED